MNYRFDFSVILENYDVFLRGTLLTLELSAVAMVFSFLIAIPVASARMSSYAALRLLASVYVNIIRNTPFLVQLFFVYFALPSIGLRLTANVAAIVAMSANGGAYTAEVLRGGFASIEKGQREAGFALGLTPLQILCYVILKPAMRAIYPALISEFVLLILASSVAAYISATELTASAQMVDALSFRSFEIYFVVTLIYLLLSMSLSRGLNGAGRLIFSYPTR